MVAAGADNGWGCPVTMEGGLVADMTDALSAEAAGVLGNMEGCGGKGAAVESVNEKEASVAWEFVPSSSGDPSAEGGGGGNPRSADEFLP